MTHWKYIVNKITGMSYLQLYYNIESGKNQDSFEKFFRIFCRVAIEITPIRAL